MIARPSSAVTARPSSAVIKAGALAVALVVALAVALAAQVAVAQETAPYRDPTLSVEERVADLLGRMTLEEKIGQMTLVEQGSIAPADVARYAIGGVLSGGGGYPPGDNTVDGWLAMVHGFQDAALGTRLGIPILYGVDAVHGHANLAGATVFPHNVGLGAADDPDLVEAIARATALEMIATGIYWNYAPVLAVPRDIRWGRTYEGYGEDPELVTRLATAMLRGLQGDDLAAADTVLATPKHFVADGGAMFATSPVTGGLVDRGDADIDDATLRRVHLAPYVDAVDQGARSIMISFSSVRGVPMHAHEHLVQEVLRGELGFDGFVLSDWGGIDVVAPILRRGGGAKHCGRHRHEHGAVRLPALHRRDAAGGGARRAVARTHRRRRRRRCAGEVRAGPVRAAVRRPVAAGRGGLGRAPRARARGRRSLAGAAEERTWGAPAGA